MRGVKELRYGNGQDAAQSRDKPGVTPEKIKHALALMRGGHFKTHACTLAGFSVQSLNRHCKKDAELAEAVDQALEVGLGFLEDLAMERAINGWEWRFQVTYPDGRVQETVKPKFDSNLLLRLLERRSQPWTRNGKPEASRTLHPDVRRKLEEIHSKPLFQSLDESLPGGLAGAARDGILPPAFSELVLKGIDARDADPGAGDVEPARLALPPAPSDNGATPTAPAEEAA